jgi:hypothetical protein
METFTYGVEMTSIEEVRHWPMPVAPKVRVDFPKEQLIHVVNLCLVLDRYLPASQFGHEASSTLAEWWL